MGHSARSPPMKTKLLLLAVGLASFLAPEKAQSQTLSASFVEVNPNATVYGSVGGGFFMDYPSGVMVFTDFTSFCVEPTQSLSYGQSVIYDIQDPSSLANASLVAKLMGAYLYTSSFTAIEAAAVQWAIWEVVAETSGTLSVLDGNVIIDPQDAQQAEIANLANWYLANVNDFDAVDFTYLTNDEYQDVAAFGVVPEPATVGLIALSALVLGRRRRR